MYMHACVDTCKAQLGKSVLSECLEMVPKSPLSPSCSEGDTVFLGQLFQGLSSYC